MTASATHASSFPGERPVTPAVVREHNLNELEYGRIVAMLGRTPTLTELGVFSALWSEHCSYKHSKPVLKRFPTTGPQVVQGPGENAGVLRLPDGWAVAFKIESHNHPSAVEPYQGAATGVGGILRDVFTMGARPVAVLNSLRFGPLDRAAQPVSLCRAWCAASATTATASACRPSAARSASPRATRATPSSTRCASASCGRPTWPPRGRTASATCSSTWAPRPGATASTAPASPRRSCPRRARPGGPQVQVGDPFTEKLLLEASLELITSKLIVAIQDMGAAGLTSSSAEMAARGGVGVEIDTGLVPTREPGMTPYEILLSESQERMLVVAEPHRVPAIQAICRKWELDATEIGHVTDDGLFRVKHDGLTVAEIPGAAAGGRLPDLHPGGPRGARPPRPAARPGRRAAPGRASPTRSRRCSTRRRIASKRWVYEQYDSTVQASTVLGPGSDAGVFRVGEESFALAVSVDCNNRLVGLDPYEGGKATVAEAARNVACTGAVPLGITDCLNFGNPEKPEVFFQFRGSLPRDRRRLPGVRHAGHRRQCLVLQREPDRRGGPDADGRHGRAAPAGRGPGAQPLPGRRRPHRDRGRHRGARWAGRPTGPSSAASSAATPPPVDLEHEARLQRFLVAAAEARLVRSAHDCSEGGLAVALAECGHRRPLRRPGVRRHRRPPVVRPGAQRRAGAVRRRPRAAWC